MAPVVQLRRAATAPTTSRSDHLTSSPQPQPSPSNHPTTQQQLSTKTTNPPKNSFKILFAYLYIHLCINLLLKPTLIACPTNNKLQLLSKLLLAVHATLLIACIVSVLKSIRRGRCHTRTDASNDMNCDEEIMNENGKLKKEAHDHKDDDDDEIRGEVLEKPLVDNSRRSASYRLCFLFALIMFGKLVFHRSIIMSGLLRVSSVSQLVVFKILIKCKCLKILVQI